MFNFLEITLKFYYKNLKIIDKIDLILVMTVNPGFANGSTEVGTVLNFAVPAPGALALLGAAGLVGARRRKA